MASKTCSHLLRISLSLHSLEYAFNLVVNQNTFDKFKLSLNIDEFLKAHLIYNSAYKTIKKDVIKSSYTLSSYFNKQKLALAGYEFEDWSLNFSQLTEKYHQLKHKDKKTDKKNDMVLTLAKKIMLLKNTNGTVSSNEVNQRVYNSSAQSILAAFVYLADKKLGSITQKPGRGKIVCLFYTTFSITFIYFYTDTINSFFILIISSKISTSFTKITKEQLLDNQSSVIELEKLEIDVVDYLKTCNSNFFCSFFLS